MVENKTSGDFISRNGDNTETLLLFLDAFQEFIQRGPFIFESLNKEIIRFREALKDSGIGTKLLDLAGNKELFRLIDIVEQTAKEVKENDYRTSLTGVVRALTDEDIQRALAFILLVLKRLGQELKD